MVTYSIIIPHYNIPDLLVRCLKSIPIREDIQVIVVDDCSPNADTYKERFLEFSRPYLEWYSTPQGGSAGRARNIGLEHAKGKWILFADADDFFTENLSNILEDNKNSDADVIHFKAEGRDSITLSPSTRHIERNNAIDAYFNNDVNTVEAALWFTVVWSQMISRSFIKTKEIIFDETIVSNDVMFAAKLACLANKIKYSNETLYVITTRNDSLHDSKHKNGKRYIIQQQVELNFHRFISAHDVKRTPPCMLKVIQEAYRSFGFSYALQALKMIIKENALFYGLNEYIQRHRKS